MEEPIKKTPKEIEYKFILNLIISIMITFICYVLIDKIFVQNENIRTNNMFISNMKYNTKLDSFRTIQKEIEFKKDSLILSNKKIQLKYDSIKIKLIKIK